jgi:hypothetical protein
MEIIQTKPLEEDLSVEDKPPGASSGKYFAM